MLQQILIWVGLMVLSWALAPDSELPEDEKPAGFDDFTAPTAEEGKAVPVLFGTRRLDGPNCVWWGDLKATPIKKSAGEGKKG